MDSSNPFANLDQETQRKIQEIQLYEQTIQQISMQKRSLEFELKETQQAVEELEKAEGEVFKIVAGQVVIRSEKEKLLSEMKEKKELLESRFKNIQEQEKEHLKTMEKLRDEILEKINNKETK